MDFKLDLLGTIKQHLVFYISLFLKDSTDPLFKQIYLKPKPVKINNNNDKKYKINDIVDVKMIKKIIKI